MNNNDARINRRLALLVLASFAIFVSAVVLRIGIGATPYNTTDSSGRPMGFNDPLHAGHFFIMVRNFSPAEFFRVEYAYEWALLAAHVVGLGILLAPDRARSRIGRWFFMAQGAFFPFGFLALPLLPSLLISFLRGHMDRESFIDIPFIVALAHPVWVVVSLVIGFALRGDGLGLSRVQAGIVHAGRAGARTLAKAIR
jgi:hypothetical protein